MLPLILALAAAPAPTATPYVPAAFRGRDYAAPVPMAGSPTPTPPRGPRTLADVARERKLAKERKAGVFSAAEAGGTDGIRESDAETFKRLGEKHKAEDKATADHNYWSDRIRNAERDVDNAERDVKKLEGTAIMGGGAIPHSVAVADLNSRTDAARARLQSARQHLDLVRTEARAAGYEHLTRPKQYQP